MKKINRTMTIGEIFEMFPAHAQKIANELTRIGLNCVGCGSSTHETLEAGMYLHGEDDEAIERLEDSLNKILETQFDGATITLTERAAKKFITICEEEGQKGAFLAFGVKLGGCSGYEYVLDFSTEKSPSQEVFHHFGVDVLVEKSALSRLIGCEIDYLDSLNSSGFKISNPNAKSSCACGSSQSY